MLSIQSQRVQWLTFRLYGGEYALTVGDVVEVLSMVALAHMPEAQPWLAGMLNLRGRVVPVIDLRLRLDLPARPIGLDTPVVVAQWADRLVGLIVDEVTEVLTLAADALSAPDELAGAAHPVLAVARTAERLILLLDLQRLCDSAQPLAAGGRFKLGTSPAQQR
jgi:purine-binding chemotaxis protein CheW